MLVLLVSLLSLPANADTSTWGGAMVGTKVQNQFKIHQDKFPVANDLHFKVWQKEDNINVNGWDIDISGFNKSSSQRGDQPEPQHSDGDNGKHAVDVKAWAGDVPYCTNVKVDVDFWLTSWNTIRLSDVHWTRRATAGWKFRARHNGRLWVWGTINCVRGELLFYGHVTRGHVYRGSVPRGYNDYEIVFIADPPGCTNRNKHYKVVVRRYYDGKWHLEELSAWIQKNVEVPVMLPVIADMRFPSEGGLENISCVVDLEEWMAAGPPELQDSYEVTDGTSPNLPGFLVGQGAPIFNPDAPAPPPACWNYPTQCHGDTDGSGDVKVPDFLALKNSWFRCEPNPDYDPCADFDRDGCVKASDFLILKNNWYRTVPGDCPPPSVVSLDDLFDFNDVDNVSADVNTVGEVSFTDEGMADAIPDIGWTIGYPEGTGGQYRHTLTITLDDPDERVWLQDLSYIASPNDVNDLSQVPFPSPSEPDVLLDPNNRSYEVDILTDGPCVGEHIYHKFTISPDMDGLPDPNGTLESIADHIVVPSPGP